jgi:hypothetical protein
MRIYLAGPMSDRPQFNFPAFFEAAERLRFHGFEVISPAENDPQDVREAALKSVDGAKPNGKIGSETWGDALARDVKLIADGGIQAIVFLPDWHTSRGARLEAFTGLLQPGFKFFYYYQGHAIEMDRAGVLDILYDSLYEEAI